jgi:ATP-binding cassette, subfamily B, bacterial MsbA
VSNKNHKRQDLIMNSWVMVKRIFRENGRDYVGTYVVAIIALLFISLSTAFVAWVMRDIINEIFYERRKDLIVVISVAVFLAFLLRGIASYIQAVGLARVGNNLAARYQRRVFEKLMSMDMKFFASVHSGSLTAQINQNVAGIRDILNITLTSIARDIVTLVALIGVMIYQDPILTCMSLLIAPPLIIGVSHLSRRVRSVTHEAIILNSSLLGSIQEATQGVAVVKAYTMEAQLVARIDGLIKRTEERSNKIAAISERTAPIAETLAGVAVASVIAYSGYRAVYNAVPPGSTFSFITALLLVYDPVRRLARMQVNLERAFVNAKMIYDILDMNPRQPDSLSAIDLVRGRGEIKFTGVDFSYEDGTPVLSKTTFTASAGKTTAIVGPSGSGKSTIAALILRFHDPKAGTITINGIDISSVTKQSLRQSIAYVSQQPYLFEGSIRDNIRFGRPEASDVEVETAARLANAHEFILEQASGYDTLSGENGVLLSGGQRQRISIARAILRDAPVILLDEATSALDNDSEKKVQEALETAMKGRTTIVIAHRLSTVINADKIITLMDGQIVEEGTHKTLIKHKNGIYARFFAMQNGSSSADEKSDAIKVKKGRHT